MSLHNRPELKSEYGNYIGGKFVPAADGHTFDVVTPIDGSVITKVPRSNAKDVNAAIDAAHAFATWKNSSVTERSNMLLKLVEENHHYLAAVETLDNGKSIRETIHADIALVIDHFRYFAGVIRAEEGTVLMLLCQHQRAYWRRCTNYSMELPVTHGGMEDCTSSLQVTVLS